MSAGMEPVPRFAGQGSARLFSLFPRVMTLSRMLLIVALLALTSGMVRAGTPTADEPPPVQPEADAYVIGPGDVVQVFVWRNPELSVTVPVRPDGKISTPLVENMVAIGKSAQQLSRDMEGVLSEYVRSPKVNIIVTTAASAFSLVKVVGQVARPQAIPYREGI